MRKSKKAKYRRIRENVYYSSEVVSKKFKNFLARSSEVEVPECRKSLVQCKCCCFLTDNIKNFSIWWLVHISGMKLQWFKLILYWTVDRKCRKWARKCRKWARNMPEMSKIYCIALFHESDAYRFVKTFKAYPFHSGSYYLFLSLQDRPRGCWFFYQYQTDSIGN